MIPRTRPREVSATALCTSGLLRGAAPAPWIRTNGASAAAPRSARRRGPVMTVMATCACDQPRAMNGIFVAMIVTNWTFASNGKFAMNATCAPT